MNNYCFQLGCGRIGFGVYDWLKRTVSLVTAKTKRTPVKSIGIWQEFYAFYGQSL
jgi:hypothetical protein